MLPPKPAINPLIIAPPPTRKFEFVLPHPELRRDWTSGTRIPSPQKQRRTILNPPNRRKRATPIKDVDCVTVLDTPKLPLETQKLGGVIDGLETLRFLPMDHGLDSEVVRDSEDYQAYVDLVGASGIGIVQLSKDIFVVQGWDARNVQGT
ncbi:hypothetical protein H0H81_007246, partial [Sphagnurus paluster]